MINQIGYTIRVLLILLVFCSLTGCLTESLLEKRTHSYSEEVVSILLTEDKNTLVFLGKLYHYVFETPDVLVKTLQSSFYPSVGATFRKFDVDKNGHITGSLTLHLGVTSPPDHKAAAVALGYECKALPKRSEFCKIKIKLKGMRYVAGDIPIATSHKLNRTYFVRVREKGGPSAKILLTPITVAADGALFIVQAPLAAVALGTWVVLCQDGERCK